MNRFSTRGRYSRFSTRGRYSTGASITCSICAYIYSVPALNEVPVPPVQPVPATMNRFIRLNLFNNDAYDCGVCAA
jgi:hypothetical protein